MKHSLSFILVVVMSGATLAGFIGRKQTYAVRGQLRCQSQPKKAARVTVKLYDEDPGPDDKIAQGKTDAQGNFELRGSHREISRIDPVLHIYHDCNDGKPCHRHWKMKLPKKYINSKQAYDLGSVNLEMKLPDEGRKCFTG